MCLYPKLILNKKYTATIKNGGVIPPMTDIRAKMVPIGCGKCMECRTQKARDWKVRLLEEIRNEKNHKAYFVTLTFSDEYFTEISDSIDIIEGYHADNEICRLSVRRWLERIRKKTRKSIKHWLVTEIGGNFSERVHMHGIIWTNDLNLCVQKWSSMCGDVWVGEYCNESTVTYGVKYFHKIDLKHKEYLPKIFCSPGIGSNYFDRIDSKMNEFKEDNTRDYYKSRQGYIMSLPIYFRNKLYNDDEKEYLWMRRLDEQIRYVDGIKIDVSDSLYDYYKCLEEARRINKMLGFGDDSKDWKKIQYENSLRMMGQKIKK